MHEFHRLITLDKAIELMLGDAPAPRVRSVHLKDALGRILAENIIAKIDVPHFDRAAMDGYAVRSEDCIGASESSPVRLRIAGSVSAGSIPDASAGSGEAVEVSTGSAMPDGADAVVMVEHADAVDGYVMIRRPVHPYENVQRRGADVSLGERVLSAGTQLGPREIGMLAALGMSRVNIRSLRVGVASTGNEILSPDETLMPCRIYDVNTYMISSALSELGAEPVVYGVVPDSYDALSEAVANAVIDCDMVILSGSTSAGRGDMLYRVVSDLGELEFHGINLKPGKPTFFGRVGGKPVVGLPGYPTSALTVFWQLVSPMIHRSLGLRSRPLFVKAALARPFRSESRRQMLPVILHRGRAYPFDRGSGAVTTLAASDGFVDIPADREYLHAGEVVDVNPLSCDDIDIIVSGESCPLLEDALDRMDLRFRYLVKGSLRALSDLQDGLADLACVTATTELPPDLTVVASYRRELGLISRNPDLLLNPDGATFAAWSRESGIRSIMDLMLPDVRISLEIRTHSGAALAVLQGKADLAVGIKESAEMWGLQFKYLAEDVAHIAARTDDKRDIIKAIADALMQRSRNAASSPSDEPNAFLS
ncbi:MAG: molybdopterin biosynthesis protein [Methanothrix sp.]|nr:molybdopterin biosynthesis protein [Methanothrix sp.]MCX8207256.1 molybdopterin biosynthesis protein [Methanothrix sp.]